MRFYGIKPSHFNSTRKTNIELTEPWRYRVYILGRGEGKTYWTSLDLTPVRYVLLSLFTVHILTVLVEYILPMHRSLELAKKRLQKFFPCIHCVEIKTETRRSFNTGNLFFFNISNSDYIKTWEDTATVILTVCSSSFMPNNAHILGYALRELSLKIIGRQLHESTTYVDGTIMTLVAKIFGGNPMWTA